MCVSFEEDLIDCFLLFNVLFALFIFLEYVNWIIFGDPEDSAKFVSFCWECYFFMTIQGGGYCASDDLLRARPYIGVVPVRRDVTRRVDDVTSRAVACGCRAGS